MIGVTSIAISFGLSPILVAFCRLVMLGAYAAFTLGWDKVIRYRGGCPVCLEIVFGLNK